MNSSRPWPLLVLLLCAISPAFASSECPKAVVFDAVDGGTLDLGSSGIGHATPMFGWSLRLALGSCAGNQAGSCGDCEVTGLIPAAGGRNQRCANDSSVRCIDDATCTLLPATCEGPEAVSCTSDADCPLSRCSNHCTFFAAPPNPLAAGGYYLCLTSQVRNAVSGTVDAETGSAALDVPFRGDLFYSAAEAQVCPTCDGDVTPNDDVADGTCNSGLKVGAPCDANASGPYGAGSFDCPPAPGNFHSTLTDSTFAMQTGVTSKTVSTDNRFCRAPTYTDRHCLCGICNSTLNTVCSTNADCPPSGGQPGICNGRRCTGGGNNGEACNADSACPGGLCRLVALTAPNGCWDDTSTPEDERECFDGDPVGDNVGFCSAGPVQGICDPPDVAYCSQNAHCPLSGNCQFSLRPCYLDSGIVGRTTAASGVASPPVLNVANPTVLAGLQCLPMNTESQGVNEVLGLPGLGRLRVSGAFTFANEVVVDDLVAGDTISSDAGEADGATANDTTETAVTAAVGGEVKIIEGRPTEAPPVGGTVVGDQVVVDAPAGTAADPLTLTFHLDGSAAAGNGPNDVDLRRNGVVVPPCVSVPPQPISPDPCVLERTLDGDDIKITSYSSHGSTWDVVAYGSVGPTVTPTPVPTPTPTPTTEPTVTTVTTESPTPVPSETVTPESSPTTDSTASPIPTSTPTASVEPTLTPTATATATPAPLCPAQPAQCRAPAVAGKAEVTLVDKAKDKDDQLTWKWVKGALTTRAELGDPLTTDGYALCVYDGSALRATLSAPAGGLCGKKPCWKATKKGFTYADRDRTPDGISQIVLKEGVAGKAQITVKAKGIDVPMPVLSSLTSPLTVQLRKTTAGPCWGTVFSFPPAGKNDAKTFKDKAD